ncbi:hypothetical protein EXIGLDRAFT_838110 [Exidia glandulosa HHB12029]|uniref:Cation/H+ exchanger transmembrane domain-containing protein n=1 Tax=Exidia glandulosa HHB12029 TaxID=1314781 RepID=A0A165G5D0_EXIGL|nr:hypothetical protein EXIGLDRAFT_838110 [Exidia glandulosa HHB12029]
MREFSTTAVEVVHGAWTYTVGKRAATEQGGLLSGKDPSAFNTADPLRLFIIQLGIIILTTQLLALVLGKFKQPKVIAEVIGGILLGPTVFGRIPGFTQHVFPLESRPYLSLVANIGLVLFLFLVGLEIEGSVIKRNARLSFTIACAGMVLPFGLGAGLSKAIYDQFVDPNTVYTHFLLFVGVSFAITAFPVLCRILTELKLLDTTVGIVVLSAGVGNDIVGWVLLALAVALVNASSGLTALWILLVAIGWTLLLLLPGRAAIHWLARRTGSIQNGPSTLFMTVTVLLMFGSAFFTDIIGVHPIFGGFLVGLIVPRDGGLAIAITEKLEDIVAVMLLPLYFALSGLSTDLSLLNNGITWGYVFAIIALAYLGKFGGCTIAAHFAGFTWRESAAIGSLMSCKGLIELIVLNVGLSAHILDTRVFSMFVLEALVLTFMTTPAVQYFYPPRLRVRASAGGVKHAAVESPREKRSLDVPSPTDGLGAVEGWKRHFTVVLDKVEHLPAMMTITQLVRPASGGRVDALRMIELSDRTSAVMRSSAAETLLQTDPLIGVVRALGELGGFSVQAALAVVPPDAFASSIDEHVQDVGSDLVLVSWSAPHATQHHHTMKDAPANTTVNPLGFLFGGGGDYAPAVSDAHFVRSVFATSSVDVALYVDPGHGPTGQKTRKMHFVLPFFGGPDDRLALEFAVQLCASSDATASVVRIEKSDDPEQTAGSPERPAPAYFSSDNRATVTSTHGVGFADTMYGNVTTQTRMQSETADNVHWTRYASPASRSTLPAELQAGLARMHFSTERTPAPLATAVRLLRSATTEEEDTRTQRRVFGIVGRSRRLAVESHREELAEMLASGDIPLSSDVRKTLGDAASAVVASDLHVGVVVVQASLNASPA